MVAPTGSSQKSTTTSKDVLIDFLAGGTGLTLVVNFIKYIGLIYIFDSISKTAVASVERVKLLLQTQDVNQKIAQGQKYNGYGDCLVRCIREEGQTLNCGMAGATGLLFVYPFDCARTRLGFDIGKFVQERQFKEMNDCIIQIYKLDVFDLYHGFPVGVAGIFVYRAFYLVGYDTVDLDWKFAINVASSETEGNTGAARLYLKLTTMSNNGTNRTDIPLSVTLEQFYALVHQLEKAKLEMDVYA
ncbi:hypothetical protein I4U23_017885 [Adineta vaga]|nr:hypothetical protein I4U23_017885 [Adineta vaga]